MNLSERQCRNRWEKRTYRCSIDEYFRRAPKKLKDNVKRLIMSGGYVKHNYYLPGAIYECYRIDISQQLCNELIDHYCKK